MKTLAKHESTSFSITTFDELNTSAFIKVNQQHTNIILNENEVDNSPCDGIRFFNNTKNKIAIKTADCLPIYLRGEHESVFLHAGWKGLKEDILVQKNVLEIKPVFIYIGPSIQKNSFEVQDDFIELMPFDQFYHRQEGKLFFNLQGYASHQLSQVFPNAKQIISPLCTFENHQFHSYRRDKTALRNWHIYSSNV